MDEPISTWGTKLLRLSASAGCGCLFSVKKRRRVVCRNGVGYPISKGLLGRKKSQLARKCDERREGKIASAIRVLVSGSSDPTYLSAIAEGAEEERGEKGARQQGSRMSQTRLTLKVVAGIFPARPQSGPRRPRPTRGALTTSLRPASSRSVSVSVSPGSLKKKGARRFIVS